VNDASVVRVPPTLSTKSRAALHCSRTTPTPEHPLRYLHTMVRVSNLDSALDFYCHKLGLVELRRTESEQGRFTLVFLAAPADADAGDRNFSPLLELTYNWDPEAYTGGRNFGHLAYEVDDIHAACARLAERGVTINRPPRDGRMAFIRSPDGISIELLQSGAALAPAEPWQSMPNTGVW
jgi:lactoylglutathione lyase